VTGWERSLRIKARRILLHALRDLQVLGDAAKAAAGFAIGASAREGACGHLSVLDPSDLGKPSAGTFY
jgi:hypothetical protein